METTVTEMWKQDRIGSAERGENPTVIARMPSGYAVMGDTQFLPGYCVLLAAPQVAHLFPRYDTEPPEYIAVPVWRYPHNRWTAPEYQFSEAAHGALKARIAAKLHELMQRAAIQG